MGELLEQLGGAAILDLGAAVDDEVLAQPGGRMRVPSKEIATRGIAPHVLELALSRVEVGGEQLVALDPHPDAGDLRATRRDRG